MRDHTSLRAWQTARFVALEVLRLARTHWRPWVSAPFGQVTRSALSVQLNITEGYSFGDAPSFTRHLRIAYGSALEVADTLALLRDCGAVDEAGIDRLIAANQECRACLVGMLRRRDRWPTRH